MLLVRSWRVNLLVSSKLEVNLASSAIVASVSLTQLKIAALIWSRAGERTKRITLTLQASGLN